jgi:hypothetical protein
VNEHETTEIGLPAPFRVADFDGTVEEWVQRCRWQLAAALDGHVQLEGRPVLPLFGLDKSFWHTATTEAGWSSNRVLDLHRCALMGQVWDLLERLAAGDPQVVSWRESKRRPKHGGKRRYLMAAPVAFGFVVRLRERRDTFSFLTAYPLGPYAVERMRARAAAVVTVAAVPGAC